MTAPEISDGNPILFGKDDPAPDPLFYTSPRKVVHIDDGAIAAVTQLYRELLPPGGAILDLMSSWRSHLPPEVAYARVAGLGMNAEEMRDNPQLTEFLVHNLNENTQLPYGEREFDAACCCVSVQYLQKPIEVFASMRRVLKPGAPFVLSFSNRCFPTKAVNLWLQSDDAGHMQLVKRYLEMAGGWRSVTTQDRSSKRARAGWGDPLYAVWAYAAR
jgi:Methyltransferase domain